MFVYELNKQDFTCYLFNFIGASRHIFLTVEEAWLAVSMC